MKLNAGLCKLPEVVCMRTKIANGGWLLSQKRKEVFQKSISTSVVCDLPKEQDGRRCRSYRDTVSKIY